jgi:hypothetical protein
MVKKRRNYKSKIQPHVGYEADSDGRSTPVPSVGFDERIVQLGVWGITEPEFDEAETLEKKKELLRKKGVSEKAIDEFCADLQSGKGSPATATITAKTSSEAVLPAVAENR